MSEYHHTQRGKTVLAIVALVGGMSVVAIAFIGRNEFLIAFAVFVVLMLVGRLFSTLTVMVTQQELRWHFGPGIWKKSVPRSDIASATPTRTKWWYGFGIRLTPRGWLYNVSGLDAVAVEMRTGKIVLIGTDEPDKLAAALADGDETAGG